MTMLQNLGEKGLITNMFNRISKEEKIPECWEPGVVIPLFKKGEGVTVTIIAE